MERFDLLYCCIPVATLAVAVGVFVGIAYQTERTIAPAPAIVFEPQAPLVTTEVPRSQLIPRRHAEPSTVAEPASFAEPPTVVAAAEPLALRAALDASLPEPRWTATALPVQRPRVAVPLPVPKPKLAMAVSARRFKPPRRPVVVLTPPSSPSPPSLGLRDPEVASSGRLESRP